jgi:Trypsin-co-occurring domain 2
MAGLELASTVAALRRELVDAVAAAQDEQILFPVGEITVELQVTVSRDAEASAGVRFWVVEVGAGGSLHREQVHRVTVTLAPPVDRAGEPVKVFDSSAVKTE